MILAYGRRFSHTPFSCFESRTKSGFSYMPGNAGPEALIGKYDFLKVLSKQEKEILHLVV